MLIYDYDDFFSCMIFTQYYHNIYLRSDKIFFHLFTFALCFLYLYCCDFFFSKLKYCFKVCVFITNTHASFEALQ